MMRWKKEVLCVLCVCAVCALSGCGNRDDQKSNPQSETITDKSSEIQSETDNNAGENTLVPEDTAIPGEGNTDGNGSVNDTRDDGNVNDVTDNGTGVGGAAKDIVDGVGDAGKDIIDGVEDAGDALTGEEPADTAR